MYAVFSKRNLPVVKSADFLCTVTYSKSLFCLNKKMATSCMMFWTSIYPNNHRNILLNFLWVIFIHKVQVATIFFLWSCYFKITKSGIGAKKDKNIAIIIHQFTFIEKNHTKTIIQLMCTHITYNVNASSKPHFCKAFNLPQVQAASP